MSPGIKIRTIMGLKTTVEKIEAPDKTAMRIAKERQDSLTKPTGSLGTLEELSIRIAGITGETAPELKNKVIITMAGDHGVTDAGVSAYPKEITAQMIYNFVRGGAAINVLARHVGARVVVVDMGVAADIEHEAAEKGADIVCIGDMGIGNTTPSSAITTVITGAPVRAVTGRGAGIDDATLEMTIKAIEDAIRVNHPDKKDPIDVLAKVGGFEFGGMAGVMLAAAARGIPVVIDGFVISATALIAYELAPAVKEYMIAAHLSVERGHSVILDYIGLKPLLDLNMRLGEGTGAALGMSIIEATCKILNEMATFEEASASNRI